MMRPKITPANEASHPLLTGAQRQIYRRLRLVGLGPAAFYLDACRLMATEPAFASTTHLVAHLLREIESALREGLSSVADQPETSPQAKRASENNHLHAILAVLRGLEIPETDPAAQAWVRLAGKENMYALHARAHRDNLAAPRSLDHTFRSFWAEMERILDTVTERFEARYLAVFNTLDQLVAKPKPSDTDIKQLQRQIPHNDLVLGYFFDRLNHAAWLEPLSAARFFSSPPPPQVDQEQGTIAFPGWSASHYLSRMTPTAPSIVVDIALAIPNTDNARVHRDIAEIAAALPADLAVHLIPNIVAWLESPYTVFDPLELAPLVSRLAAHGSINEALELLAALLAILPDPRATEKAQAATMLLLSLTPEPRFNTWYYRQILDRIIPALLPLAWEKVITLLCDLLETAIRYSRYDHEVSQRDSSSIWRPAIEDHEQNREGGIDEVHSLLTSALRDAAVALMPQYGTAVLSLIENRPYNVFRRIGLHLRRTWPDVDPHGTTQRMIDPAIFDESGLHHEYFHLLHERYAHLLPAAQQAYLALVTQNGDPVGWTEREVQDAGDVHGGEQQRFVRYRQYRKLWPIQNDLDQRWRQHFDALQVEFGPLDHPDFLSYLSMGEIEPPVGPPLPPDLGEMTIVDLATWLESLVADDTTHVTPTGLVDELTRLVVADPHRFSDGAEQFQCVHLFYRTALLRGFYEAIKQSIPVRWSPVLALCASVVVATTNSSDQLDPAPDRSTARWARRDVLDLVSQGLHTGAGEIPFTLRQHVWRVLEPLTDDPDPDAADEAEETSGRDLANRSINSVRGEALHGVIRYALWIKRHTERLHAEPQGTAVSFATMPEVRSVLDRHLDPHYDSSLIIRSVYGQWIPWLVLLDQSWVQHHLEALFPQDAHNATLCAAAWEAYIVYCSPYNDTLDVLQDEYSRAIAQLHALAPARPHWPDPQQHLVRHLMMFYGRGKLTIDDPLIADFFYLASDDLRNYALTYLGRNLTKSENGEDAEYLERLQQLWLWRINAVDEAEAISSAAELGAFGLWFSSGVFDNVWAIAQLEAALIHGARFDPHHTLTEVVERLALIAPHMPRETIRCFNLMIDQLSAAWLVTRWVEHASLLLSQVLKSDDQGVRQQARALINQLSARGDLRFRYLLDDHAHL